MTRARPRLCQIGQLIATPWLTMLIVAPAHTAAAAAGAPAADAGAKGWAPRPAYAWSYPVIFPLYPYPGACWYSGACVGPWWDERQRRRRPAAPEQPDALPAQDIWSGSGSPWGYLRRLPPPTAPSQIQPAYRDASTIRPEFAEPAAPSAAP